MSYSTSSADTSPRPFVVSSPDRVLVRALPHPLASTNKKVTLSLRRSTPSQPSSSQPLSPQSPLTPDTPISTFTSSEPSRAPLNIQIPNSPRRISMLSSLASPMSGDQDSMVSTRRLAGVTGVSVAAAAQDYGRSSSFATVAQTTTSPTRKYSAQFHKNGLPIKSAMKSPVTTPGDVRTSPVALCRPSSIRSYSSPTPLTSPKYVHFNTQLEHVRLFLQGETPACVGERETLVDPRQHDRSTSDIKVTLSNWTPVVANSFQPVNIDSGEAPLRVETVVLSEDQTELRGKILVQNIAFHKHVAVRYTIDFWQTQCEVGAEFEESIKGTSVDRFSFVIPLDMERTLVEKTFCLAVRYRVIGREFWDSNNGMNYHIECKRVVVVVPPTVSDLSKQMTSLLLGTPLADYSKPVLKKKLASRYDLTSSLSAAYSQPIAIPTRSTASNLPFGAARTANPNGLSTTPPSQTAYRPSEYITPSPPQNYHHSLYASSPKFMNPYLAVASPPEHFRVGFDMLSLDRPMVNKRGTRNSWNVDIDVNSAHPSSATSSNGTSAITIPSSPARSQSYPVGLYGSYSSSPKASAPISIPNNRVQQQQQQGGHRPAVGSSSYFDLVDRYCFYESSPHTSPYSSYPNSPPAPCIRAETTTTIWKEAMGKIDEWGVQATNSYNAARNREHRRAVDNGRLVPRSVPNPKWNVSDLLRGITPKSMLTEWCAVFRTPQSIAKTVLHKFVGYLETLASERIWKPRWSATIAWEQTQGISVKDKTSKYTGPRGYWSQGYGYIGRDGFCPCGASLATHEDRICPEATLDPRAADERRATTIVVQSQVQNRIVTGGWLTEEFGLRPSCFRTPPL
ncbi:putative phosphatase regulatory subunit-domain-containing protein [Linnemannia elongata]|nr:putative phosphatase regulatory subunit-domain-containing protein [Linnemannia elongata]